MNKEQLVDFVKDYLSSLMNIPASEIDADTPLERYGVDSTATVGLSGELSDQLGMELSPNIVYDHPTINAISDHLVSLLAGAAPHTAPLSPASQAATAAT